MGPVWQLLDRLVVRRADHECGPRPGRRSSRRSKAGGLEAADQLLLPERDPRASSSSGSPTIMPEPLKKVFLLTTGSEAVECAIKLCRTHGVKVGGRSKHVIVSFDKSFHGRTLGIAAGRRHSGIEGMDRQSRPRLRAGSVPRWLPHARHELRFLPEVAAATRAWRRRRLPA